MKLLSLFFLLPAALGVATSAVADERKVIPSIAMQQEYNDNLYFSSHTKDGDFISTVSPALEVMNNTERLQSGIKIQLDSSYYHDNPDLNSIDQDYSGTLRYGVSPTANLFTSAGYRRDSRVDRDFTQTGFVLGAVNRDRYNYRLGGDYALSEAMGMQATYSFDSDYYEDSAYSDYKSHDISFLFSRDLSAVISRTVARMKLGMTRFNMQGSQVTNYSGTIGAERSLDERFSFFADLGLRYTQSEFDSFQMLPTGVPGFFLIAPHEEQAEGWGPSGQAGVTYNGELDNAKLVLSHGVTAASGRSGTVQRTALQCNVGRKLSETSRVAFFAGYFVNKSTQDEMAALAIDENSLCIQPKMLYALSDQVAVEASYSYALVHNKVADTDASRNLVLLRLVFQYPLFE